LTNLPKTDVQWLPELWKFMSDRPFETFFSFADIPHFKEVVIMATVCDYCGHKTNEVKSGGGIEPKGKRISLNVTDVSDISRDVLKVSTATNPFSLRLFL
jgi:C4-type Zn-finger protein